MKARGKREAKRSASPLVSNNKPIPALKGRNTYFGLSGLCSSFLGFNQGRRAPLRFALAPGCHISRRWRSGLDFYGARCPVMPRRWRSALRLLRSTLPLSCRAVGALRFDFCGARHPVMPRRWRSGLGLLRSTLPVMPRRWRSGSLLLDTVDNTCGSGRVVRSLISHPPAPHDRTDRVQVFTRYAWFVFTFSTRSLFITNRP